MCSSCAQNVIVFLYTEFLFFALALLMKMDSFVGEIKEDSLFSTKKCFIIILSIKITQKTYLSRDDDGILVYTPY